MSYQSEPVKPAHGDQSGIPEADVAPRSPPEELAASPRQAVPSPLPSAAGLHRRGKVRRTRVSAVWVGFIITAVILMALLIFIGQNSRTVAIHYLGLDGHVPLAVALLVSAVAGILLVAVPGTARILQLRRALKKTAATSNQPINPA